MSPGPTAFAVVALVLAILAVVGGVALSQTEEDGPLVAALVAAALLALPAGLLVQEIARRPVRRLSRRVSATTGWEASIPLPPQSDEDLAEIGAAVNELTSTLRSQLEAVATERGRLEQTLAAAADVVIAVDVAGGIVYANEAASSVLMVGARESLGHALLSVLSDHEVYGLVSSALSDAPEAVSAEIRRDERHYHATARPVIGGGLWAAVLVMQDVTAAYEAESARREFVANVSHELRTPLAAISAAAETLELGVGPEDAQRFHTIIHQEAGKLGQLVEEMLDLARLESGLARPQLQPVDITLVTHEALERIRPQAERAGLELSLRQPAELIVDADADLVARALANLLHNAVKFTPAPGRITLEVRAESEQHRAWLLVRDTGVGIAEEEQGRVFQRFYRADRARQRGQGTGLGLALVRHIAESHGGTVRVESRLGEGSTFEFSLASRADRCDS